MTKLWRFAVGCCLTLAGAPAAAAEPALRTGPTACALAGWSADADPKGLNVRAAPSADSRVVGVLPPPAPLEPGGPDLAVSFEITAGQGGWLRIRNAVDESAAARPVFAGEGWVSGRRVRFGVQSAKGFLRPDPRSAVAVDFGRPMEDLADVRHVLGCSGEWALIEGRYRSPERQALAPGERPRAGVFRAWVRGVCGNQITTCDGVSGD
jgi:hypothetical protein